MQVLNKQDPLDDYLASVYIISHSQSTVSSYRLSITNKNKSGFRDYLQQKHNLDEMQLLVKINNAELDVYKTLRDFVIFLDQSKYSSKSIQSRLAAVKGYLRHIGIKIYTEDCKNIIRIPKNIRHREEPVTKEMILRVLRNVPAKLQTIILVLTSSGMRIGELVQLKLSDIDLKTKPTTIRIRAETTKTKESRETFLTTEATNSLKDYLTRFFGWKEGQENTHLKDTQIFGRTSIIKSANYKSLKTKQPSYLLASSLLMKILTYYLGKIPELDTKNPNGRRVIHFHAFRKYFRTAVGNACGRDFAETLIGHKFYMSTYYNLSEDQKRDLYLKAEPYLTISDNTPIEKSLKELSEKYHELEDKFSGWMQYCKNNNIPVPDSLLSKLQ